MYGFRRWGRWGFDRGPRLSILEIVKSGTLDLRLAGLLWLLMEHRTSVIVAAGPSFAGKTTTLNVLTDFLRPEVKEVRLKGDDEDFSFLKDSEPTKTYMVAEEFSDHFAEYVWGDVAIKAFNLLTQGYALGGAMHARTAQESLALLHHYLGLPLALLGRLGAVVTLSVSYGRGYDAEPVRRIDTVSLVRPADGGLISLEVIAFRGSAKASMAELAGDSDLRHSVAAKTGIEPRLVIPEMEKREQFLKRLLDQGKHSRDEVRQGILEFYRALPA